MAANWPKLPAFDSQNEFDSVLPSGWRLDQIENLFQQLPIGKRFDQKTSQKQGAVPIIDQSESGIIGWHDEVPGVTATTERPVVTFANHTCEMRWMRRPFSVIQNVFPLRGKPGICDTRFLYYGTKGRVHLEEYKGHFPDYRRKWIPVPPLPEQRTIAHILGTLDDRIEANRRMAATLEEMVRTLFRAWFVTFDPVRAKAEGRWRLGQTLPGLPASLYDVFPDHLVETEHGEAPVGWMEAKIGSVLERLKVGKLYDQKSALSTGLVPILDQGKRGSIGFHNDEPNIHADPENRVCTFANHTCVLRLIDYSFSTIQNVIPFRGTAVPTEWIYYASEGKQEFEEYRGHWPSFVEQKIIVPPPQLASVFRDVVDPIVTRIAQNELHSRAIATIRDTLLPGLVSGKIRVKDADAFLKVRGL